MQFSEAQDLEVCERMQEEEWQVLESIYPDYVSKDQRGTIKLEIPVELPEPRFVMALPQVSARSEDGLLRQGGRCTELTAASDRTIHPAVANLPPLLLEVLLPPRYPLHDPPQIIAIHATQSWLSPSRLHRYMLEMWQAGEGVLYAWVEFIRSSDFLDSLGLIVATQGSQYISIPHPTPRVLIPLLIAYDKSKCQARFAETSYNCEICLTSIKGSKCIRLSCSHVFCRPCLQDFWTLCIAEGDVGRVGCPDPQCVKERKEVNEDELRRVVSEEEVRRWKWLRQKRLMERDPTMLHCPMSFCQAPVAKPINVEEGSGWERLRTCPECDYSFCAYCKRTWHGPLSNCPIDITESFVLEYLALEEGSPERKVIEQRYGTTNVRKIVARFQEEQATKKWMDDSTTSCPSCCVKVQKSMGCNHMTCGKCGQHFCYRCGGRLDSANPYKHFSTPGLRCFNKLFDVESIQDGWQPVEGFDLI